MAANRTNFKLRQIRAFTLAELMISIALVLLLMLGINQVFKVTGEAVGTNQAVSTGMRDARAAQAVMSRDFNAWATDSPAIIIRSERVSAFRNRADELADRDWNPTAPNDAAKLSIDLDGDGIEGNTAGETIPTAIYNHRSHRVDVLSFFGRDLFRRQTGGVVPDVEEYVADMSASEAWIWYGHLRRPDERAPPTGTNQGFPHRDPGDNPNPPGIFNDKNFHATDFLLGRMAILLNEGNASPPTPGTEIQDKNGRNQRFIARTVPIDDGSGMTTTVAPLARQIQSNDLPNDRWQIQWSRYDLANTSISQFSTILRNFQRAFDSGLVTEPWYDRMGDWRFQGDPQPLRPLTARNIARTTPAFLANCTQFIVEYAGDFVLQDAATNGTVTAYRSDDTQPGDGIDYIEDPATGEQRIRWYGMPRDVSGADGGPDGIIRGTGDPNSQLIDVVPLHDVLDAVGINPSIGLPPGVVFFERRLPRNTAVYPFSPAPPMYANVSTGASAMAPGAAYVAAWGPDSGNQPRPKLIRIVVTIDDPQGRIADGQTFEYVFRVGG